MNIAIDGPAGSGKSTIAKKISASLGCVYADTGAMYRAMALLMLRNEIDLTDASAVEAMAETADIAIEYQNGSQHVLLNGEDVTSELRQEKVGESASKVSVYPGVRAKLVALQQKLAKTTSVVMDGRDIGTVVLPDAEVKIYLTADPAVRAKRRFLELEAKAEKNGESKLSDEEREKSLRQIEADIIERDHRDMTREHSPLRQAEDAILADTSNLTIDEVVDKILAIERAVREGQTVPTWM